MRYALKRYFRLYRVFARNNLVREMEFRGNFWAKIGVNLGFLVMYLVFIDVLFRNTQSIAGWNKGQMLLLFGTFLVARALMDMLFAINLAKIPELVRLGTMDFVLTKPVPSQFLVSTRYLSLDELGTFFGAIAILIYAGHMLHLQASATALAAWAFLVLGGLAILYAVQMLLMTLSFYLVKLDNLSALVDTVVGVARYPAEIFARPLRLAFTYILPLAFIAYVPTLVFKNGVQPIWLLTTVIMAVAALTAARYFWNYASRAYTSASS